MDIESTVILPFVQETPTTNCEPNALLVNCLKGCWSTIQFKTGPLQCPGDTSPQHLMFYATYLMDLMHTVGHQHTL